jgi:hypothetical protein
MQLVYFIDTILLTLDCIKASKPSVNQLYYCIVQKCVYSISNFAPSRAAFCRRVPVKSDTTTTRVVGKRASVPGSKYEHNEDGRQYVNGRKS